MKKYSLLLITVIAFVITFHPAFKWMFERYLEADSYYSHGFLVPFITAFMIWRKKDHYSSIQTSSSIFGLVLLIFSLILYISIGLILHIGFASGVALIIALFGLSLYLFGTKITRIISFPILFLIFMVPAPMVFLIAVTFKLKILAAIVSTYLVSLMGLSIRSTGSLVFLPNGILTIGNECSGINSLISLFMLSIIFAYFSEKQFKKRLAFVVLSFPIAMASNIVRIVFLILAAYVYGTDAATKGPLHFGAGIALWISALLMLSLLWGFMNRETVN